MNKFLTAFAAALLTGGFLSAGENLWYNSDLELSDHGWCGRMPAYAFPQDRKAPPVSAVDDTTAAHGKQSLKITTGPHLLRHFVTSPDRTLKAKQKYTVSFYAKAEQPVQVGASMLCNRYGHWHSTGGKSFRLGPEWQRYSFSFVFDPKGDFVQPDHRYCLTLDLRAAVSQKNVIHYDALQLEEGDLTDYKPAANLEFYVKTPTYYLCDKNTVKAKISAISYEKAQKVQKDILLIDRYTGKILQKKQISADLKPGIVQTFDVTFDNLPYGSFRIRAAQSDDASAADFVRIRSNHAEVEDGKFVVGIGSENAVGAYNTYGGAHAMAISGGNQYEQDEGIVTRMAGSVIGKGFDGRCTAISILAPEKRGEYNWKLLDLYVAACKRHHLRAVVSIPTFAITTSRNNKDRGKSVPDWLRKLDRTGHPEGQTHGAWHELKIVLPPPDVIGGIAGAIAKRYGKDVFLFRLFSEANGYMTPVQLCEFAKSVHEHVKAACPEILTNTITPTEDRGTKMGGFFAQVVRNGGCKYTDVVGFHPYDSAQDDSPNSAMEGIAKFRKSMKDAGGPVLPMGEFECFFLVKNRLSNKYDPQMSDFRPEALARRILIDMGEGLLVSSPVELSHLHSGYPPNMFAERRFARPVPDARFAVHNAMGYFLNGADNRSRVPLIGDELCYVFRNHNSMYSTIWNVTGKSAMRLDLPAGVSCEVFDIFGNRTQTAKGYLKLELDRIPKIIRWSANADPRSLHLAGKYTRKEFIRIYGVKAAAGGVHVMFSSRTSAPLTGMMRLESPYLTGPARSFFYDAKPFANTSVFIPAQWEAGAPESFPVTVYASSDGKTDQGKFDLRTVPVLKIGEKPLSFQVRQHNFSLSKKDGMLQIRAELVCSKVTPPKANQELWQGDCAELFFDFAPQEYNAAALSMYNFKCVQFQVAMTKDGIPEVNDVNNFSNQKLGNPLVKRTPGGAVLTAAVPWVEGMQFNVSLNAGGKSNVWRGKYNYKDRSGFAILVSGK